jgi:hypothetical protein
MRYPDGMPDQLAKPDKVLVKEAARDGVGSTITTMRRATGRRVDKHR